jgi:hypothetical protein
MHLLYAACARDEKKFFLTEIIKLDRSFSKLFEFRKSDEKLSSVTRFEVKTNVEAIRDSTF